MSVKDKTVLARCRQCFSRRVALDRVTRVGVGLVVVPDSDPLAAVDICFKMASGIASLARKNTGGDMEATLYPSTRATW